MSTTTSNVSAARASGQRVPTLSALADLAFQHPRRMALLALLTFLLAGALGGPAAGLFKAQDAFQDPHSDSARAEKLLKRVTGREASAGVLVLVAARPGSAAVSSAASAISRAPDVATVSAPLPGQASPFVSAASQRSCRWRPAG